MGVTELGFEPRSWLRERVLSHHTVLLLSTRGRGGSPLWTPGIRVVLNIFSYWAEHKGRIPISKARRRSQARDLGSQDPGVGHTFQDHSSVPSPQGQPSYWQDSLAVQAVWRYRRRAWTALARTRCLHRRGVDDRKSCGPGQARAKRLRSGLCRMEALTSNTGLDPNRWDGEFQTVIVTDSQTPHSSQTSLILDPGNYEPHPLPSS